MPEAKLIKALEREGFFLEFPLYQTREEIIIDILKEGNQRIFLSLPLFLRGSFNYQEIVSRISNKEKLLFDKTIVISERIYRKERIQNDLKAFIQANKIKAKFSGNEFKEFYREFQEVQLKKQEGEQKDIQEQSRLRLQLNLQQSLRVLFSPAKLRIMNAIFNHQPLTNTELKYYYKAISSINRAILNRGLQDYVGLVETVKKLGKKD